MLAATPLNAETTERSHRGRRTVAAAYATSTSDDDAERRRTSESFSELTNASGSSLEALGRTPTSRLRSSPSR